MKVGFLAGAGSSCAIPAAAPRDVDLAADDGLDALRLHGVIEGDGAVHIAVVGHGAGRHLQFRDAFGEGFDLYRPVQEAVVCMQDVGVRISCLA